MKKLKFTESYYLNSIEILEYESSSCKDSKLRIDITDSIYNEGYCFIFTKEQFKELKEFIKNIKE